MTSWLQHNRIAVHFGALGLVLIVVSAVLLIGYDATAEVPEEIAPGEPSPEQFRASERIEIEDDAATEEQRVEAANAVDDIYVKDPAAEQTVFLGINNFYRDLEAGAYEDPEPPERVVVPTVTGFSVADAELAIIDAGLVPVRASSISTQIEARDGTVASTIPVAGRERDAGSDVNLIIFVWELSSTTTQPPTTTTTVPENLDELRIDPEDQVANLLPTYVTLGEQTITDFVTLHENDIDRISGGEETVFDDLQATAIGWAEDELDAGIQSAEDLQEVQQKYLLEDTRPPMSIPGLPEEDFDMAHGAVATLVARSLQVNEEIDQVATDAARQAASDAVEQQYVVYEFNQVIVDQGETLSSIHVEAITRLDLYQPEISVVAPSYALALVGALSVLLFVFLLFRIAPQNLERTRDVVLLAIMVILTVFVARVPDLVVSNGNHAIGYVIPAVTIGMMVAILFDQRTALLMAVPMAGFTAIATSDITFTVYAAIATVVPVAFVSAVSTRAQLRLSVLGSAAVAAPIAGALEYLFRYGVEDGGPWMAMLWAFIGAFLGGFLAQGVVSFLETAFGVTTTMTLLDLLDRNHPALQELEEKAPGTFNHSMLVGSLAGRAARSIKADPLLAQAAAWYHDLGKTANPQYFVENQLGHNPHDDLDPVESAELIRSHVTDGLVLAKRHRIPEDVSNGIRMHHGTSLMRYFYHKALTVDGDVNPEDFRHHGEKPVGKEMAIVMISDASEAAARAYAQQEQPTEVGLKKLVDDIVAEKLDDGQFDNAALTFGELTTIRLEIVAGLSAYYHARVEYPDFPSTEEVQEVT